jgi:hypothetical protein
MPDRVDVRDWVYQPTLAALPDQVVNLGRVPKVLDQRGEGACTGFALAAVINFLLHARGVARLVSPFMLYHLARRYDDRPGEAYEGASARGAMKGWLRHGVCSEALWPEAASAGWPLPRRIAREARLTPGGAYYRVSHKQVRDLHAALAEAGALYVTLLVHPGWQRPGPAAVAVCAETGGRSGTLRVPVIRRRGAASEGHAVAVLGYTAEGFLIQNSWGEGWGTRGFALLPYEDYVRCACDVWALQAGVPVAARITG